MSLFTAVECCLEQLPEGSTVSISTDRRDGRPSVEFTGQGGDEAMLPTPTEAMDWGQLVELADGLGASVEVVESAYGLRISLPAADASSPPRPLERLRTGLKRLRGESDE
jgi:hypothetical protein